MQPVNCSVNDCPKMAKARGWCDAHWHRWRVYGSPLAGGDTPGKALAFLNETAFAHATDDCLIWPFSKINTGYACVRIFGKTKLAHRVICERVNGQPLAGQHAAHTCGQGKSGCVSPKHLVWKTKAENEADKIDHGKTNRGERQGSSKLTEKQVTEIRRLKGMISQTHVADRYHISATHVSNIQNRKVWAWFEADEPRNKAGG